MSYRIASKRFTTTILCIRASRMTDIRWPYSMAQPVDNHVREHHFLILPSRMDINKSCIKDWKCLTRYLIQVTRHILKCRRMDYQQSVLQRQTISIYFGMHFDVAIFVISALIFTKSESEYWNTSFQVNIPFIYTRLISCR
jgi:hypothetical protein